jgi:hypothetical protein
MGRVSRPAKPHRPAPNLNHILQRRAQPRPDASAIALAEWRRLLCEAHRTGRAVLEKVLVDRIVLTPMGDGGGAAGRTAPRS